jgi:transposase
MVYISGVHGGNYPPLPAETRIAGLSKYPAENVYLKIGDCIETLAEKIMAEGHKKMGVKQPVSWYMIALASVFQYDEYLNDHQASEAGRTRLDWKYALHLPISFPGFPPKQFCEFRQYSLVNDLRKDDLSRVMEGVRYCGFRVRGSEDRVGSEELLDGLCLIERLSRIEKAFQEALETAAAEQTEWLRSIVLSHWYKRYPPRANAEHDTRTAEELVKDAQEVGDDSWYFLGLVREDLPDWRQQAEILRLGQVFEQQYQVVDGRATWRSEGCKNCPVNIRFS